MPQGEKWEISIDFFVESIWLHVCITCAHKMLIKWNFRQSPSVLFFFKELVLFSNDISFSVHFTFLFYLDKLLALTSLTSKSAVMTFSAGGADPSKNYLIPLFLSVIMFYFFHNFFFFFTCSKITFTKHEH